MHQFSQMKLLRLMKTVMFFFDEDMNGVSDEGWGIPHLTMTQMTMARF